MDAEDEERWEEIMYGVGSVGGRRKERLDDGGGGGWEVWDGEDGFGWVGGGGSSK